MNTEREIYVPPGGPPRTQRPDPAIYEQMGEGNIFAMIQDFYDELAKSSIGHLFPSKPEALEHAAVKSAAFFVGLLGGPPLYHMHFGNPMMRARHMPFVIDEAARQEWLACFDRVLERAPSEYNFPAAHMNGFRDFLVGFSTWMVNTKRGA